METIPKLLIVPRSWLAHLGGLKTAVVTATTITIFTERPYIAALLVLTRELLSYYERISVARNPINIKASQTISQPTPIEDKSSVPLPEES
ncbi:hypothetical protein [Spirosoma luteum]|uniref:hypothetical protein n=1 Tax=Spirosoma luteum TaxID=431553 RepID=UPI000375A39A|nr:hypothetical protein [Spirosoma luteum]